MDKKEMARALVELNPAAQKEQEQFTQAMMDNLNRIKNEKIDKYELGNDLGYADLRAYKDRKALQLAVGTDTPFGTLELAKTANPMGIQNSAMLSNQMPINGGMAQVDLLKSLSTPENTASFAYTGPVGQGQMQAKTKIGHDAERQRLHELQVQYLQQLNKNMGIGVYGKKSPTDQSIGLQFQGRW